MTPPTTPTGVPDNLPFGEFSRELGEELARGTLDAEPPVADLVEALSSPERRTAVVRSFLRAARERVRRIHTEGGSGVETVGAWTALVDHLVTGLYQALLRESGTPAEGHALFALGGYGREELSPHSDLDLLIVHPGLGDLGFLVEGFLHVLWDCGLDVQCVARTVEENIEVARADIRSRTSLLEGRFLAGDEGVRDRFDREIVEGEIFRQGVKDFVKAKFDEMKSRHRRYGSTVYVLEPNLKEGEGGLRDIQTAVWVAKVRFKVRSVGELILKGVIPPSEIEALDESRDFLLRLRNSLHFLAGRREDRLTYEHQDEIAPQLGFRSEGGMSGAERLLQEYYASANRVQHFARTVMRRAASGLLPRGPRRRNPPREVAPGVRLRGDEIYVSPRAARGRPLTVLAAFEAAQVHDAELSPQALEVIRENLDLVDDRFRRDPAAVQMFLRILGNPRRVATTLMRMHDVRFLDRFIPEFGRIFGRVQRDLYHMYPVDVHSLFAVQELRYLARGEYAEQFPLLTERIRGLRFTDILYLATLLHDVGKGDGHGHEERGAEIALAVGDRMGLDPEALDHLVFLVRNHLLLSHTAQRRDLHDEDLIVEFARKVGDQEALDMLYLLSFADIRAVGPGAWTNWKHLLFKELYEKASRILTGAAPDPERRAERVRAVKDRVRKAAEGRVPPQEVEVFLEEVEHPQYLLANPVEALVRHLEAFIGRVDPPSVVIRPEPDQGYTEVLLATRDQPGLFATVAGLMAAHRLNILSAVLNTRTDDWVLDVFHVSGPPGEVLGSDERWERWRRDLRDVLRAERDMAAVVGQSLWRRPGLARPRPRLRTQIRVDDRASQRFTVIDVTAADRLGLLYDIARTLADQGLTIRLAKIATNIDQVADSFYVERLGGGKVSDPAEIAQLETVLEQVIASGEPGGKTP